jgi:hypothetical protein
VATIKKATAQEGPEVGLLDAYCVSIGMRKAINNKKIRIDIRAIDDQESVKSTFSSLSQGC